MIIDFLLFPFFCCILYAIGSGALSITRNTNYPDYFHLIAGLLTIGFISVIVNFFLPVHSNITYLLIGICFGIGTLQICKDLTQVKHIFLLCLILTPYAVIMHEGYDTGLYHIPHQLWIREEKIVFGLANIHGRLGFSSLIEYINAPLWIDTNLKLLAYSQASFAVILLLFIRNLSRSENYNSHLIALLFAASSALYIFKLRTNYHSTDLPLAILFSLTFFYGLSLLLSKQPASLKSINILLLCALFSALIKTSGILILLWVTIVLAHLLHQKFTDLKTILTASILPFFLGMIWISHNYIISGCLLFPIKETCMKAPWSAYIQADNMTKTVVAWARGKNSGFEPLNNWNWIPAWLSSHKEFIASITGIIFSICLAYKFFLPKKIAGTDMAIKSSLAFAFLSLFLWFIQTPEQRFGLGTFIIIAPALALTIFGLREAKTPTFLTKATNICLLIIIAQMCYIGLINKKTSFSFNPIPIPTIATIPAGEFGTRPADPTSDQCWAEKYCSATGMFTPTYSNGYMMFTAQQ